MPRVYDKVKSLLQDYPDLRDSDKRLIWVFIKGYPFDFSPMSYEQFNGATEPETITRCRRKIQERFPELRSSKEIQAARSEVARQRGTHIFRKSYLELANPKPVVDINRPTLF